MQNLRKINRVVRFNEEDYFSILQSVILVMEEMRNLLTESNVRKLDHLGVILYGNVDLSAVNCSKVIDCLNPFNQIIRIYIKRSHNKIEQTDILGLNYVFEYIFNFLNI